jgi:hypothetical protein
MKRFPKNAEGDDFSTTLADAEDRHQREIEREQEQERKRAGVRIAKPDPHASFWKTMQEAAYAFAEAAALGDLVEVASRHQKTRVFYFDGGSVALSVRRDQRPMLRDKRQNGGA